MLEPYLKKISKIYNSCANGLVKYSQLHGYRSWIIFLFVFTWILAISASSLNATSESVGISGTLPQPNSPYLQEQQNAQLLSVDTANRETRGVWLTNVDSDVLFTPENTTNAIAELATLNFNTLYPTVWNWGYTLYPSEAAQAVTGHKLDPEPGLQGRDVLEEIIQQGHEQGMAVIPWFEFGFMAPADSELAQKHPQWLTKRANGDPIWWEGKTHQRVWLNPLHPEVQEFISSLIVELVSNYQVDGIQLDDHFGYPYELGYDSYTVELYQQEHDGQSPPEDPKDPDWIRWRADKITAYMEKLFAQIKAANPDALVSVSPNPQTFSLNSFLLDWQTWERKGLIEELIVQLYRSNQNSFIKELSRPELIAAKQHIPVSIGVLSGLKGRSVLSGFLKQQVNLVRERDFAGVSFFFYESLWNLAREKPEARKESLLSLFTEPAIRQEPQ